MPFKKVNCIKEKDEAVKSDYKIKKYIKQFDEQYEINNNKNNNKQ